MVNTKQLLLILLIELCHLSAYAQNAISSAAPWNSADRQKLSSSLRRIVAADAESSAVAAARSPRKTGARRVCALVRTADATDRPLLDNGCRPIAQLGDIFVADIPMSRLRQLAADRRVCRVEAERAGALQLDSMRLYTDATDIYTARNLPRAYNGEGVVVGVMDVGFDLTHPTFRRSSGDGTRVSRFWDQLSADTVDSRMYVGRDFTDARQIASCAHSRDAGILFHGTHTLGIAAGNGAGTKYAGMAPESDICLVSNAVTADREFISDDDLYKYTTATDVLGFKYIFDYAESVGAPCVASFSEGSRQEFYGDNLLYYEALRRLVGPGRIIVASAGNLGTELGYLSKPSGRQSAGTFVTPPDSYVAFFVRTRGAVDLRTTFYDAAEGPRSLTVPVTAICAAPDSLLADTVTIGGVEYVQTMQAYASCFDAADVVVDVVLERTDGLWLWAGGRRNSFELVGAEGEAEAYSVHGYFSVRDDNPSLCDATSSHSILSPGSAPDVICVGATGYRPVVALEDGSTQTTDWGPAGQRAAYSSVGPTVDGRGKPDVMAPGSNIVSAIGSYYMERNDTKDILVARQADGGRVYGWGAAGGTSMSTPAVAGIVALWLQANPRLSPADVLAVMRRTCKPCGDYGSATPLYCGYGAIDAYAGLLDVLGLTGVGGISASVPRGVDVSVVGGNRLRLAFDEPLRAAERLAVYGIDGRLVLAERLASGESTHDTALCLAKGVYAVQIGRRGSVLVRIK